MAPLAGGGHAPQAIEFRASCGWTVSARAAEAVALAVWAELAVPSSRADEQAVTEVAARAAAPSKDARRILDQP